MSIEHGYASQAAAMEWLGLDPVEDVDEYGGFIDAAVNAVSRWIDKRCRCHFYQVTEARQFGATSRYVIRLGAFNDLADVMELRSDEDGDGTYETIWAASEHRLYPLNANAAPEPRPFRSVRAVGRRFPITYLASGIPERVEIEGIWGWPEIPDAIHQACKIQVARIVKRKEAPEGIIGLNQFGVVRVAGRPDPDVASLMGPYRLKMVG